MNARWNQGGTDVWEYPGINPNGDTNSAYTGSKGRNRGFVRDCKEVRVTDYAWSEIDGEFYVLIESRQAAGWTPLEFVDFEIARRKREAASAEVEFIARIAAEVDDPAIRALRDVPFEGAAIRSLFDVYIHDDRLIYVKSPCSDDDLSDRFFLHITPVNLEDLAEEDKALGFGIFDFYATDSEIASFVTESGCIVATALPEHDIQAIYTGQVIRVENDSGEVSWQGPVWHGGAVIEHDLR